MQHPDLPRQQTAAGSRIPTLDEVFDLASRMRFDFNVETKIFPAQPELAPEPEEFVRLVFETIRKHGLESRAILQSFDFRTLRGMKKLAPGIRLSALYEGPSRNFVEIAREAGAHIVSPVFPLVTPEQVMAAHAQGLEVIPWTANSPAEWDRLIAAGVDGIITDDPGALIAHLGGSGLANFRSAQ